MEMGDAVCLSAEVHYLLLLRSSFHFLKIPERIFSVLTLATPKQLRCTHKPQHSQITAHIKMLYVLKGLIIFSPPSFAFGSTKANASDVLGFSALQSVFWDALLPVSLYLGCFHGTHPAQAFIAAYSLHISPLPVSPSLGLWPVVFPVTIPGPLNQPPLNKCLLQGSWRGGVGEDTMLTVMAIYIYIKAICTG